MCGHRVFKFSICLNGLNTTFNISPGTNGVNLPPLPGTLLCNVFFNGHRVQNTHLIATSSTLGRFRPKGRKRYACIIKLPKKKQKGQNSKRYHFKGFLGSRNQMKQFFFL